MCFFLLFQQNTGRYGNQARCSGGTNFVCWKGKLVSWLGHLGTVSSLTGPGFREEIFFNEETMKMIDCQEV